MTVVPTTDSLLQEQRDLVLEGRTIRVNLVSMLGIQHKQESNMAPLDRYSGPGEVQNTDVKLLPQRYRHDVRLRCHE